MKETFDLNKDEIVKISGYAFNATFLDESAKAAYLNKLKDYADAH